MPDRGDKHTMLAAKITNHGISLVQQRADAAADRAVKQLRQISDLGSDGF